MSLPRSWTALQNLLVYLLGAEEYNVAVDKGYRISDEFGIYNPNILPKLQAGLDALVQDDRTFIGGQQDHFFIIVNKFDSSLWWNNESGWGACSTADVFNLGERTRLQVPVDGVWFLVSSLANEVDRLNGDLKVWQSEEMR